MIVLQYKKNKPLHRRNDDIFPKAVIIIDCLSFCNADNPSRNHSSPPTHTQIRMIRLSQHCLIHGNHLHQTAMFFDCFSHCSPATLLCARPTQDLCWPPTRPLTGHTSSPTAPALGPLTIIRILFPTGLPISTRIHIQLRVAVLLVLRACLPRPCWRS